MNRTCRRLAFLACLATIPALAQAEGKRDALFLDDDEPAAEARPATKQVAPPPAPSALRGHLQFELARSTEEPKEWTKLRTLGEIGGQGRLGDNLKWKANVRLAYDSVFDVNDRYPEAVRKDQQAEAAIREAYLDANAGDWDFRFGRQHVVWGEMVGLFFADVVSARDMREFILPEFDTLRTPQWAVRAEWFKDDFHAEALWIPVATYDDIGKPGGEFYPYQPVPTGFASQYRNEVKPERDAANGNYGLRLSLLKGGWDMSAFYYRSMDAAPTFHRQYVAAPTPTFIFEAHHERITQVGGTLTKDFDFAVLKGEAVHTRGRSFAVLDLADADGLVAQDTVDWALGLDFPLPADTRFNVQYFQRVFRDHDPALLQEEHESGYSVFLNKKFGSSWEAQVTWIASINRSDSLLRPRLQWNVARNWRWLLGADIFKGQAYGMFGQYAGKDRVWSELRYSF
jgi:hypothetical protein